MSVELIQELNDKMALCYRTIDEMKRHGLARNRAEVEYRTALAVAIQSLRAQTKHPASLIPDMAKGMRKVAEAKRAMDDADTEYETDRELVMLLKRDIDTIREQIAREWQQAGRDI